jgi:uncharacterized protein (TIGR03435 family)
MLSRGAAIFFLAVSWTWLVAQQRTDRPVFDVASLKSSPEAPLGQNISINLGRAVRGEVALGNTTLCECIRFAYGLVSDDQVDGPDWIKDKNVRFDVLAKAAPDTPRDRLLLMLQTLLDERFKLAMHREPRRINHYALTVAKGGPKMRPVEPGAEHAKQSYGRGRIFHAQASMETLAMLLSRNLRQAVLDNTGLQGTYDVKLEWAPETDSPDAPSGPSLFTAIQDQLGLKLEARKDPIDVLVVDRTQKVPVGN